MADIIIAGAPEPFRGAVNVRFLDTILASSDATLRIDDEREGRFLIPFADIYFDYLERTGTSVRDKVCGVLGGWRVSAGGRAADDVLWTLDEPTDAYRAFQQYGIFDSRLLSVEVNLSEASMTGNV